MKPIVEMDRVEVGIRDIEFHPDLYGFGTITKDMDSTLIPTIAFPTTGVFSHILASSEMVSREFVVVSNPQKTFNSLGGMKVPNPLPTPKRILPLGFPNEFINLF